MRQVLLVRHGRSEWNAEGRWQGRADAPLSAAGAAEAKAAAARLAGLGPKAVACSPLSRARATAEVIASELGLEPLHVTPGLEERDVGPWSGRTAQEIDATWPGLRAAGIPPEGWEHDAAVVVRVLLALGGLLERVDGDPLVVVTHGGVIRALEHQISGEPASPIGNLGARWISVAPLAVRLGDRLDLLAPT